MRKYLIVIALIVGGLTSGIFYLSCEKGIISEPYPNQLPDTKLFIQPDTCGFDTTSSTQYLNWWGVDPDGEVIGYFYQWSFFEEENPDSFIWTTSESDTFHVPIRKDVDYFWFKVKAVDNSAKWDYPEPTISETDDEYFSDTGSEYRVYDSLDVILYEGEIPGIQTQYGDLLTTLRGDKFYSLPPTDTTGAVDPTPAYAVFPIKNSPPSVSFVYGSNPSDTTAVKTFTIRSFFWIGTDPDGNESITNFFYALFPKDAPPPSDIDDFANGYINGVLESAIRSVTLRDIPGGEWVFYLAARDIAGQASEIIRYPKEEGTWTVVEPVLNGTLFIDDYANITDGDELYPACLDSLLGPGNYSNWNIEERIPYSKIDIKETLDLFNYIIYYADGYSQLSKLSNEILNYVMAENEDNHILISSINATDSDDSLYAFLSSDAIDLVKRSYPFKTSGDYRINPGQIIYSRDSNYVDLKVTPGRIISNPVGLVLGADADTLYQLPLSNREEWEGEPVIGLKYPHDAPAKLIFLSFTLHNANGKGNVIEVLREFLER
ncbi:MAG: hypothetical protein DRP96_10225 [Candidatus Neomarinimicrobiota bacterium]|nr:MAG: hypothetical protein DRP96_10225 [Candidatus Neomarinimicrobiota bacterium]